MVQSDIVVDDPVDEVLPPKLSPGLPILSGLRRCCLGGSIICPHIFAISTVWPCLRAWRSRIRLWTPILVMLAGLFIIYTRM